MGRADARLRVGFVPFPKSRGVGPVWISGVGSAWFITSSAEKPDAAAALIDFLFAGGRGDLVGGSRCFVPVEADLSNLELGPLYQQVIDTLQSAEEEGVQFGYNVDVLAPPEFNDMIQRLPGDPGRRQDPEQQAADLQAAWEEGMAGREATPAP